jgi:hypothetical protein
MTRDAAGAGAPPSNPRALILVPTRELAHQVKKEASFILGKCAPSLRAGELPASGCAAGVLREFAGAPPEVEAVQAATQLHHSLQATWFVSTLVKPSGENLVSSLSSLCLQMQTCTATPRCSSPRPRARPSASAAGSSLRAR